MLVRRGVVRMALALLLLVRVVYGESQQPEAEITKLTPQGCQGEEAALDVTAARMTFDQQTGLFVFEENVKIRQCGMTIVCDRLQVSGSRDGAQVEHIIATGHVRVQRGARHVVAERAEYFADQQRLVLSGNPRAWDTADQHEMSGEEITIFLSEDHVIVKRAHVLFHPRAASAKPGAR